MSKNLPSKKVLLAFSGGFKGGAENVMLDVLSILENKNIELEVFLNGEGEVSKTFSPEDYEELNFNSFASLKNPVPFLKNVYNLASILRQKKVDVCLVEGKVLTQVFSLAGLISNTKVVSYVHFPPSAWELKRVQYQRCAKILTCCESLHKYFLEAGYKKEKLFFIRNFVDSQKFLPPSATAKNEYVRILLAGHLSHVKGQKEAIEVCGELVKEGHKIKLYFAGKDNSSQQKYEQELKELVQKLSLEKEIIFLSKVDNMLAEYHKADIFLLPSLQEGLPLVVLEAMSAGLPVVATDVDGTGEAVDDGKTGYLVPLADGLADKAQLKKKLLELIKNPSTRKEMGVAGAKRAKEEFSKKGFEEKLAQFIESA